jgi:hypothetical protein
MSDIDWCSLAEKAGNQTDQDLKVQLGGLTSLKMSEIDTFIKESGVINTDAVSVLRQISTATLFNNQKAFAISNI